MNAKKEARKRVWGQQGTGGKGPTDYYYKKEKWNVMMRTYRKGNRGRDERI